MGMLPLSPTAAVAPRLPRTPCAHEPQVTCRSSAALYVRCTDAATPGTSPCPSRGGVDDPGCADATNVRRHHGRNIHGRNWCEGSAAESASSCDVAAGSLACVVHVTSVPECTAATHGRVTPWPAHHRTGGDKCRRCHAATAKTWRGRP